MYQTYFICYIQVPIPIPKRLFGSQQKRLCNMRPEKGRKCYLLVVLLWSIHPKLMYGSKHAGQVQFSADWSGIWVSLKLKKTHYFVFCCGQRCLPSIWSIVKAIWVFNCMGRPYHFLHYWKFQQFCWSTYPTFESELHIFLMGKKYKIKVWAQIFGMGGLFME